MIRRLSPNTRPPKTLLEGRHRILSLYREWLREIPRAIEKYPLEITREQGRKRVRKDFENGPLLLSLSTLPQLNVCLLKGTQELIEVHNRWKQKCHVMRWFYEEDSPPVVKSSFIEDFFRPKS